MKKEQKELQYLSITQIEKQTSHTVAGILGIASEKGLSLYFDCPYRECNRKSYYHEPEIGMMWDSLDEVYPVKGMAIITSDDRATLLNAGQVTISRVLINPPIEAYFDTAEFKNPDDKICLSLESVFIRKTDFDAIKDCTPLGVITSKNKKGHPSQETAVLAFFDKYRDQSKPIPSTFQEAAKQTLELIKKDLGEYQKIYGSEINKPPNIKTVKKHIEAAYKKILDKPALFCGKK